MAYECFIFCVICSPLLKHALALKCLCLFTRLATCSVFNIALTFAALHRGKTSRMGERCSKDRRRNTKWWCLVRFQPTEQQQQRCQHVRSGGHICWHVMSWDILWNRMTLRAASSQQTKRVYLLALERRPMNPTTRTWIGYDNSPLACEQLCFALLACQGSYHGLFRSLLLSCYIYWSHTLICLPSAPHHDSRHTRFDIYWSVV